MKFSLKKIYTIVLCLLFAINTKAQQINFYPKPIKLNSPTGTIYAITQDSKGFIWFVCDEGLFRFDGYKTESFNFNNDSEETKRIKRTITTDHADNLWIGTAGDGLYTFSAKYQIINKVFPSPQNNNSDCNFINALYTDSKNNTWIGTKNGLYQHNPNSKKTTKIKLSDSDDNFIIKCMTEDPENIWVGTYNNGIFKINKKNASVENYKNDTQVINGLSSDQIFAIYTNSQSEIWAGTGNGLNKYDETNKMFVKINFTEPNNNCTNNNAITAIIKDNDYLWIGTQNKGLFVFDTKTYQTYHCNKTSGYKITCAFKDKAANLWFGSKTGLIQYNPNTPIINHIGNENTDLIKIQNNHVFCLANDADENVWIGTDYGAIVIDNANNQINTIPNKSQYLPDYAIRFLCVSDLGFAWMGTKENGLYRYDIKKNSFEIFNHQLDNPFSLNSDVVCSICEDANNKIWIGTNKGINCIMPNSCDFDRYEHNPDNPNSLPFSERYLVFADTDNNIWIGTDDGLYKLIPNSIDFVAIKPQTNDSISSYDSKITAIFQDSNNNIWIGTKKGVYKLNENKDVVSKINSKIKIPSTEIFGINQDNNTNLWFLTIDNIFVVDSKTFSTTKYNTNADLRNSTFSQNAIIKRKNDEMLVAGINGIDIIVQGTQTNKKLNSKILFSSVKINNNNIVFNSSVKNKRLNKNFAYADSLKIYNHTDKNISIQVATSNFDLQQNTQYAYMIEGLHKQWIENEIGNNSINITNLNSGTYKLRVRAINKMNDNNDTESTLTIIVIPPVFKTWWFVSLIAIFFIVLNTATGYYIALKRNNLINENKSDKNNKQQTANIEKNKKTKPKDEIYTQNSVIIDNKDKSSNNKNINDPKTDILQNSTNHCIDDLKNIQNKIQPNKNYIDNFFESIIINKSTEPISSSFLWFGYIESNEKHGDYVFAALGNCNKKGISAGITNIICNNLLNEIIIKKQFYQPEEILNQIHDNYILLFNPAETDFCENIEIALCRLEAGDETTAKITFAGANSPMFYYTPNNNRVSVIKGTRNAIGCTDTAQKKTYFSENEIYIAQGSIIYLTTNELISKINLLSEKNGYKKTKEILNIIKNEPLKKQQEYLEKMFNEPTNNNQQIDDIALWAISI